MSKKGTLHLTLTSDRVWYYQRWLPRHLRNYQPQRSPIFRVSLRTKNKSKALKLSRIISVKIDQLALDHFDDSEDFGRAMKLLHESVAALTESGDFDHYEEAFLMNMEGADEWLLSKAQRFSSRIKLEFERLQQEVATLREAIRNSPSFHNPDELLQRIKDLIHPPLSEEENPTLAELFEQWQQAKDGSMVETSYEQSIKPAIELFVQFVDDLHGTPVRVTDLKAEHIRQYQAFYTGLPSRAITKGRKISDLTRLKGTGKSKSGSTIKQNFSTIGTYLSWISSKGYQIDTQLITVLTKGGDISSDNKTSRPRVPFTDEDLKAFFNSKEYATGKLKTSGMFWAPLIALFSGARQAEILQLERSDLKKDGNTWIICFDDADDQSQDKQKRLKATGSRREVPVHEQLKKLGFIDYVKTKEGRLFPDEPRNKLGKFDAFSKRQATYRKNVGVCPPNESVFKDFHSIRHTVRTRLGEIRTTGPASMRFDEGIIDAIVGHASKGRSIGETQYNHSQYIAAKKKALDRLEYPSIDFDKIMSWDKCDFVRKPWRKTAQNRIRR